MNTEQLRSMIQAQPFRPFEIHLADGRSLPVEHPEVVAITPNGRTIGVGVANAIEIVDLLLVTTLKPRSRRRGRRKKQSD